MDMDWLNKYDENSVKTVFEALYVFLTEIIDIIVERLGLNK